MFHKRVDTVDQIGDVEETSRLFSVAIYGEGLSGERLVYKIGKRPPVIQAPSRTVGIENAHDSRVYAVETVIGHGHRFGVAFRFVVHSARTDWIDVTPVFLVLRRDFRIAIALARGSQQKFGIFRKREPQG